MHIPYLVLGAGPGGLQIGYHLHQAGLDYLIIEATNQVGSFFSRYPRHRRLISINKVFTGSSCPQRNLRWDWNSLLSSDNELKMSYFSKQYFPNADDLVRYLEFFAERTQLRVQRGIRISQVRRNPDDGVFSVYHNSGKLTCNILVVATGLSRLVTLNCPGAEFAETYDQVSIDPEEFAGQRVLIVGKGNSGFETGDNLIETTAAIHMLSPSPIRLAWRSHYVGHLRAVNNNLLDTYQLKSQNTILDAQIDRVDKDGETLIVDLTYSHADGQRIQLRVDRLIVCAGFRFDSEPFVDLASPSLAHNDKLPALTSAFESVNVPNMYFAGALTQSLWYKKNFSAFIHGFRYNSLALVRILEMRLEGKPWPVQVLTWDIDSLLNVMLDRFRSSSSLFQQPGYLVDAFVRDGDNSRYLQDVPVDFLREQLVSQSESTLEVSLEYGHDEHPDPFNIPRQPSDGTTSHFIHPVIRFVRSGHVLSEHHVPEDLENNWDNAIYVEPLRSFLLTLVKS